MRDGRGRRGKALTLFLGFFASLFLCDPLSTPRDSRGGSNLSRRNKETKKQRKAEGWRMARKRVTWFCAAIGTVYFQWADGAVVADLFGDGGVVGSRGSTNGWARLHIASDVP